MRKTGSQIYCTEHHKGKENENNDLEEKENENSSTKNVDNKEKKTRKQ